MYMGFPTCNRDAVAVTPLLLSMAKRSVLQSNQGTQITSLSRHLGFQPTFHNQDGVLHSCDLRIIFQLGWCINHDKTQYLSSIIKPKIASKNLCINRKTVCLWVPIHVNNFCSGKDREMTLIHLKLDGILSVKYAASNCVAWPLTNIKP